MERISRRKTPISLVLIGCALLLALVSSAMAYRISSAYGAPVDSPHTLPSHIIPELKRYKAKQGTNKSKQLQLAISLNLRNRDELASLIAAQNDPHSTSYHQYLTPEQFTVAFGPTQATVDSVVSYLKGQGLQVKSVASNHLLVDASGSVATIEQAFGVTLNDYTINGRTVYAPTTNPTVPAVPGADILNIAGLDNVALYHHAALTKQNTSALGPNGGYTPAELRTAYDANALLSNGGTGAGQTAAIFELDGSILPLTSQPISISTISAQLNIRMY